ncbi:MAG: DNA repair protein RadC [Fusicatenibacter sp.]|nr:DNA repair protein RadC [Fusicatenibacter sp.]
MKKNIGLKNLPQEEQPYEKCLAHGAGSLSDAELLAVILRCGAEGKSSLELSREVLSLFPGNEGLLGLYHLTVPELLKVKGIGRVKAIQLQCIGELSRRISAAGAKPCLSFDNPSSIADYYMERLRHEEQEVLICMMFDTKNQLLGEREITRGTVNSALISPRELFLNALQFHAVHILLVHNHPSGIPEPSSDDIEVTRRIRRAGELLGITLLDHIIIGDHCYISMLEQGI